MTAFIDGAQYQWYRCFDSQIVPLLGANSPTFIVSVSAVYTLGITYQGCTFFADCVPVIKSSTDKVEGIEISIYPNPTQGILHVDGLTGSFKIDVFRSDGHKIVDMRSDNSSLDIPTEQWPAGIYWISLCDLKGNCITQKIVKVDY
jgi:hypothetical protein